MGRDLVATLVVALAPTVSSVVVSAASSHTEIVFLDVGNGERIDGIGPVRLQEIKYQGLACVTLRHGNPTSAGHDTLGFIENGGRE
jgi:hypothetical protein